MLVKIIFMFNTNTFLMSTRKKSATLRKYSPSFVELFPNVIVYLLWCLI